MNGPNNDWFKPRLNGLILFAIAAFFVLIMRLFYLQIVEGEEYRRLSESNCIRLQGIDAPRGLLYDRNGKLLVDNRPSFDLSIVLKDARPVSNTIEKVADYLKSPVDELMSVISGKKGLLSYKPILLKQDMGREQLAVIEVHKFDLPGIVVNIKPKRYYISKSSAAHLIGYLGQINNIDLTKNRYQGAKSGDFVGKSGIEKSYDSYLRGERGGRQVEVNATGQVVKVLKTVDAIPGNNVVLTLDMELQKTAEKLMEGKIGAVVAIDPNCGDILVMVSTPSFDQNEFVSGMSHKLWKSLSSNEFRPMTNKAIQGLYPPASTYKILTAIAGLEAGVIDESTTFFCPGYHKFGDRVFRCWKKYGHGKMNVEDAITQSCDVFFYQVGLKLGVDRLAWYAKAAGFGQPTGIDLDHEEGGLIPTAAWKKHRFKEAWQAGETLSIAIGQGFNLVTPLQMANFTAAVANGGTLYRPLIVKEIETANGIVVYENKPEIVGKLPIKQSNLAFVQKGMWDVVNGERGTGRAIRNSQIEICGKTGTAQVFGHKNDKERVDVDKVAYYLKPHAWFIAYAPASDPQIAIAVMVEHGEHGSWVAPIAGKLIEKYLKKNSEEYKQ